MVWKKQVWINLFDYIDSGSLTSNSRITAVVIRYYNRIVRVLRRSRWYNQRFDARDSRLGEDALERNHAGASGLLLLPSLPFFSLLPPPDAVSAR